MRSKKFTSLVAIRKPRFILARRRSINLYKSECSSVSISWSNGLKKTSKVCGSVVECNEPYELTMSDVTSTSDCQIELYSGLLDWKKNGS